MSTNDIDRIRAEQELKYGPIHESWRPVSSTSGARQGQGGKDPAREAAGDGDAGKKCADRRRA